MMSINMVKIVDDMELPPLPERTTLYPDRNGYVLSFTADQMREYARTAVEQTLAQSPARMEPPKGGEWNAAIETAHAVRLRLSAKYSENLALGSSPMNGNMDWARLEGAVAVVRALKSAAQAPVREISDEDMLTPIEQMPGYIDPLIFGKYSVRDFHLAPSGEGPKAYEWKDKPHRLVYDLCRALLSSMRGQS